MHTTAGAEESAPTVPGFELGRRIGHGATSEVWVAATEADGRRVALKVVHADLGDVQAAARETALSATVASAHLVRIEACIPLADGRVALVMPHLAGGSLEALVAARGHLEPGEVVTVLAPVASALARLHAVGVVHGDVSPGNVLLDLDGRPHLGDLGVGRIVGEAPAGVWGSDGYVAPEVVLGADPSPGADVYSLGALGWLCLTGSVPGAPGLRPALAEVARAAATPELSALVATLDSAIDADASTRPDADALAWALFSAATPLPIHLVKGDDDVSAVTYRLRAAVGADGASGDTTNEAVRDRRSWRGALSRLRSRRRRGSATQPARPQPARPQPARPQPARPQPARPQPAVLGSMGSAVRRGRRTPRPGPLAAPRVRHPLPAPHGAPRHGAGRRTAGWRRPGRGGRFSGRAVVVVTAVVALAVAGLGVWGPGWPGGGGGQAPDPAAAGRAEQLTDDQSPDPRLDGDAPSVRPTELMSALAGARAAAFRSASPSRLSEVDAPGSAAWSRDVSAVTELRRSGVRYVGLRHEVVAATTVAFEGGRAVVRARVDTSGYAIAGGGDSEERPPSAGAPVLVDLVRTDDGWRVSDLRAVG